MAADLVEPERPEIDGYIVRDILGQGYTGTVYRATKIGLHTEVHQEVREFAIKTYSNNNGDHNGGGDSGSSKATQQRYDHEVQFLRLVQGHSNVVELYQCLHMPKAIVMPLYKFDLFSFVHGSGGLSEDSATHVMRGLVRAVQHVHEQGILHRDIKPENIAVHGADNDAILLDFDSACFTTDTAAMSKLAGTPGYMAPEVVRGVHYGTKADMFSVGGVMFYLFGRRNPFHPRPYSRNTTFRKTLLAECKFDPRFDQVGFVGKQLILLLLAKNSSQRLSAKDALNHYWFVASGAENNGPSRVPHEAHSDGAGTCDASTHVKAWASPQHRRRRCTESGVAQDHVAVVGDICSSICTRNGGGNPTSFHLAEQSEVASVNHVAQLLPLPPQQPMQRLPRPSIALQRAAQPIADVKVPFVS
eukprot:TRINITY_DN5459_c0_g1_i1.p1 TRINITY_DN5459_c0_g1~~TRINITY_DN5459_c0_g1_i1.p1  ORF type:complete len:432 (-),score=40.54 TRINITY_DN5459_c0_g1_i1:547-1794(-)